MRSADNVYFIGLGYNYNPLILLQGYIATAAGGLTPIKQISQVNRLPRTKYYKVKEFYIDKKLVRIKSTFNVYKGSFDMTVYAPCPIFDRDYSQHQDTIPRRLLRFPDKSPICFLNGKEVSTDSLLKIGDNAVESVSIIGGKKAIDVFGNAAHNGAILIKTQNIPAFFTPVDANALHKPAAWLAVWYERSISNQLPAEEKEKIYKDFTKKCEADLDSQKLGNFVYLCRLAQGERLENFIQAIGDKDSDVMNVLLPFNKPFESRNSNRLSLVFYAIGVGMAVFLFMLLITPLERDPVKEEAIK